MYKYENLVLPYIEGKYTINDKGELISCCPFHHEENPSFNFNLDKGLYHCHSCRRKWKYYTILCQNGKY